MEQAMTTQLDPCEATRSQHHLLLTYFTLNSACQW